MSADAPVSASTRPAALAATLFATPFLVGGIGALVTAVIRATAASPHWRDVTLLAILGVVFTGAGIATVAVTTYGRRVAARTAALQQQHPDARWLWRDDWAAGHIHGATHSKMGQAWIFAAFWNLLSAPMLFAGVPERIHRNPTVAIALVFPLTGLGLLWWAVRETLEWRKFGASVFEMAAVPGVVGQALAGLIQTRLGHAPPAGAMVRLTSYRRTVTGTGKNQTVSEHILWRDEQTILPTAFEAGPAGLAIPVEVRIPADATETNETNPRDSYRWRLDVTAAVPGLDYAESFDVPVFRTVESPEPAARPASPDVDTAAERPPDTTIRVQPSAGGGTEFRFPAARNPGAALGLTGFWLVWSAIVWFLVAHAAPLLFVVVFGFFDVFLVMSVTTLWLGSSRVVVEAGIVTTRASILGVGVRHRVPCADVAAVEMPIGMQSGDGSGTPYYDLRLVCQDGSKVFVGRGVRSKREAEWLVEELRRAIGQFA